MRSSSSKTTKVQLPLLVVFLLLLLSCVLHSVFPVLSVAAAVLAPISTESTLDDTSPVPAVVAVGTSSTPPLSGAESAYDVCGHTMQRRHFDVTFWKNFFRHWIPFTGRTRVKMQFYLYKRDFPDCGRELHLDDAASVRQAGYNASHPTRIIIHGWMSQSNGKLNRAVKSAYFNLLATYNNNSMDETTTATTSKTENNDVDDDDDGAQIPDDFNVIIVDWSLISTNVNYFSVVELIDDLGFMLAEFLRFLHLQASLHFADVYLIGHSLGAQIAGSTGKQLQPYRINTIYALDPAGPKFRELSVEQRLDASDADYVESIQTSSNFGFEKPLGHATFYPNFGKSQTNCYFYGCSHRRAYHYFAESITSAVGFWGTKCERQADDVWLLLDMGLEYRMGGEPSTPKEGTFYVKTNKRPPFALGRQRQPTEWVEDDMQENGGVTLKANDEQEAGGGEAKQVDDVAENVLI